MKDIEKKIAPLIEQQFPSFYRDEGANFVAFVKAYYEWMESSNNALYQAKRLTDYRDIDTTTDAFIVYFKEKYLKNIQFDVASNKELLVKNSLDLYRSKGTQQSIDLFFKLVYGTSADVKYPAEKVLRLSDGVYEKPEYLEVTYAPENVNYVGKQVVGQLSGAKAFVEKFIRRKAGYGWVNLLYISGRSGNFRNGEVIGLSINNQPTFASTNAKLVGSLKRVSIQSTGRDFKVGDIVSFSDSIRGIGGFARVESVSSSTGVVDFIFIDGGFGYTLDSTSLVSEKILNVTDIKADIDGQTFYKLFEEAVQPSINVSYSTAAIVNTDAITNANPVVGKSVYRYHSNGDIKAEGMILEANATSTTNGFITIGYVSGAFSTEDETGSKETYYIGANDTSLQAETLLDVTTISGQLMNITETYTLKVTASSGTFVAGQNVIQSDTNGTFAKGTITEIVPLESADDITITGVRGAFKNSKRMADAKYTAGTGTVTVNTTSNVVTGSGTAFSNNYINAVLYDDGNVALGTVSTVVNSTSMTLTSNGAAAVSSNDHSFGLLYRLELEGNNALYANVETVTGDLGIYNIRERVNQISYTGMSSNNIVFANNVFKYNSADVLVAEGLIVSVDHDGAANTGTLTIVPRKGYFLETDTVYTNANADNFVISSITTEVKGGDYVRVANSQLIIPASNTTANIQSISLGSGAGFGVGTIGESEVIFIGTDLLSANGIDTIDYSRKQLSVSSETGFAAGDRVYQEINYTSFNANTDVNGSDGFISIASANSLFLAGDIVRYEVAAGNTAIVGLVSGDYYYVSFANTTGLILSYPYRKTDQINTSNFSAFTTGATSESGHSIYKTAHGTVIATGTGSLNIKDIVRDFAATAGANSNVIKYGDDTVNTSISSISSLSTVSQANQVFASELLASDAFGFPKNPQGDVLDTIYSCLNFGRFEIGIIGSLNQINPGSGYNVDPFVRAYQPYISGFDRDDFIIEYENATAAFINGEIIRQTLANTVSVDLKMSSDVFGNTFTSKVATIEAADEVDNANDFIYYTNATATFNSTNGVNSNTEVISVSNNVFSANDLVRYFTDTGNTALTGLSNNTFYFVLTSNTTGITLATEAGNTSTLVNVTQLSNNESFNSNTDVNGTTDFISIASADSKFGAAGNTVIYTTTDTVVDGLANGTVYYVESSNSTGLTLSATDGGSAINITAADPGSNNHFITYYNADFGGHNLRKYSNEFANNTYVKYQVPDSNTALTGLSNNDIYYIVEANSVGFKLSTTRGGSANAIAPGTAGENHTFTSLPTYLPKDRVYTNTVPIVNATVKDVFSNSSGDFVRVEANTAAIANTETLFSYTSAHANGIINGVTINEAESTAKAIVKSSNASHIFAKRIQFEQLWENGSSFIGVTSGANADVVTIDVDNDILYPIGLNANIVGNVATANGQVSSLQIIDSGYAYANSEVVTFNSADNLRSGTAKVTVDGHGISRGYYRSSKGFLSDDIYVHDGDFYQEYSYEIFSKISVDRYADMFKRVMHMAGTRFFGSVIVEDEASISSNVVAISTGQKIKFNANTATSNTEETIDLQANAAALGFANGDTVVYTVAAGNTAVGGLTNATSYFVVNTAANTIKLSATSGGDPINITSGASEDGHFLTKTSEE